MTSFTCHSFPFEELLVLIMYIFRLCLAQCSGGAESSTGRFNLPIIGIHHMEAHALVAT